MGYGFMGDAASAGGFARDFFAANPNASQQQAADWMAANTEETQGDIALASAGAFAANSATTDKAPPPPAPRPSFFAGILSSKVTLPVLGSVPTVAVVGVAGLALYLFTRKR